MACHFGAAQVMRKWGVFDVDGGDLPGVGAADAQSLAGDMTTLSAGTIRSTLMSPGQEGFEVATRVTDLVRSSVGIGRAAFREQTVVHGVNEVIVQTQDYLPARKLGADLEPSFREINRAVDDLDDPARGQGALAFERPTCRRRTGRSGSVHVQLADVVGIDGLPSSPFGQGRDDVGLGVKS
ncbi:hypothetical protein IFM12275_23690 [Nocardia sputorum]|uniref:hypothetical protein n=1 Tax=Nocardia sputorum TaxID=2984338 RepID=UPI0024914D93|nr:hypothetical protein [Nocardia sputorum]BDT92393.1 hypothetical protein IFM12275_23690 [Nocardia sputorum]